MSSPCYAGPFLAVTIRKICVLGILKRNGCYVGERHMTNELLRTGAVCIPLVGRLHAVHAQSNSLPHPSNGLDNCPSFILEALC